MNIRLTSSRLGCRALTLLEAMIITFILAVLLGMILPALRRTHHGSSRVNCIFCLKNIGIAFRLYSTDNGDKYPMARFTNSAAISDWPTATLTVWHSLSNELADPKLLVCPMDKRRAATNFATLQTSNTSYFISLEADETTPQVLLSGDRNLTTNGVAVKPGLLSLTTNSAIGFTMEMHRDWGNVLLSDGSVNQLASSNLPAQISLAGVPINRLVIP